MTSAIQQVLRRHDPGRVVYAPNYWQWFAHHRNHNLLPAELRGVQSQREMIHRLGLDVFSRNIYCDEQKYWFGGLCYPVWDLPVRMETVRTMQGQDIVWQKTWDTPAGRLQEQLRYAWHDSTLEQEKFLISDFEAQAEPFECWLQNRRFEFDAARWQAERKQLPLGGMICAGELVSPLKMLHLVMGPERTTFFLADQPDRAAFWMRMHHRQQIEVLRQMLEGGVRAIMSMDNLDTMFHPPHYIKSYSAEFYEEAAAICHRFDAVFLIHACGRQRDNLALISSLGVDGLEGVVYPPMGDVTLLQAFEMTGDKFIITGGISALEFERLKTQDAVFEYVQKLFSEMRPFRNRFIFSASCNTPINARWKQIVWFRDAWRKLCVIEKI